MWDTAAVEIKRCAVGGIRIAIDTALPRREVCRGEERTIAVKCIASAIGVLIEIRRKRNLVTDVDQRVASGHRIILESCSGHDAVHRNASTTGGGIGRNEGVVVDTATIRGGVVSRK